jgi:hypothetical protein
MKRTSASLFTLEGTAEAAGTGSAASVYDVVLFAQPPAMPWYDDPSQVSDAEIWIFKLGIDHGCRETGRARKQPPEITKKICDCTTRVFNEKVTQQEWQLMVFATVTKGPSEPLEKLLQEYTPQIGACVRP